MNYLGENISSGCSQKVKWGKTQRIQSRKQKSGDCGTDLMRLLTPTFSLATTSSRCLRKDEKQGKCKVIFSLYVLPAFSTQCFWQSCECQGKTYI